MVTSLWAARYTVMLKQMLLLERFEVEMHNFLRMIVVYSPANLAQQKQ